MIYKGFKQLFETQPFSLVLCGNIFAMIKGELKKQGKEVEGLSIPTIAIVGRPGCGKTSLANASIRHTVPRVYFSDGFKKIRDTFSQNCCELILLDDMAKVDSNSMRDKNKKIFDFVVRNCFSAQTGIACITAETAELERISSMSGRDRLLIIEANDVFENEKKKELLCFLQKNCTLKNRFFDDFQKWLDGREMNFEEKREEFRLKNCKKGSERTTDMLFWYYLSTELVNRFMFENGGSVLEAQKIEQAMEDTWIQRRFQTISRCNLVETIWQRLLQKKEINAYIPEPDDVCQGFQDGIRNDCSIDCRFNGRYCAYGHQDYRIYQYWISDLVLPHREYDAILIGEPKYIPGFAHELVGGPLIIVDCVTLLLKFNGELRRLGTEQRMVYKNFTAEELHRELAKLSRCMLTTNGEKGVRYTVPILEDYDGIFSVKSGVFMPLKEEEAMQIRQSSVDDTRGFRDRVYGSGHMDDIKTIRKTIHKYWSRLVTMAGNIGESIEVQ